MATARNNAPTAISNANIGLAPVQPKVGRPGDGIAATGRR
jgi:hypothetical protein